MRLLIANRGEIAIRIARAADDLGIETVAVHARDDAAGLHTRRATLTRALPGTGVPAYLDINALLAIAAETGAKAVLLDPIEGNTDDQGYPTIMRANKETLQAGQSCS